MKKAAFIFYLSVIFIFYSENCKSQWVQMSNGMANNVNITSFTISDNNLFASSFIYGVYLSTNNGDNWMQTSLNNLGTISLAANNDNIFTSVYEFCNNASGVYRSTDNGLSWIQTSFNERSIPALAVIENYLFAGTWGCVYPGGIYVSSDNGINWSNTPLTNPDVESICVSENKIYAGTVFNGNSAGGVYYSSNFGATWSFLGLSNRSISAIAASKDKIYAGTYGTGIFMSSNKGANWSQTSLNNQRIRSIVINGENIFAGTETGGVFLSRDNGTSWVQKNEGLDTLNVRTLLVSNDYIFAGTIGKGVWRRSLSEIVNVKQTSELLPSEYSLHQNYPNPFNPSTNISFDIPHAALVKLTVYDALGREVTTLVNENLHAGSYNYEFSTDNFQLGSGIYFYRLTAGEFSETKRLVLLK